MPNFSYHGHLTLVWYICYNEWASIDTSLYLKYMLLCPDFLHFYLTSCFCSQSGHYIFLSRLVRLFLAVRVSWIILVFDDLSSFEEHWSFHFVKRPSVGIWPMFSWWTWGMGFGETLFITRFSIEEKENAWLMGFFFNSSFGKTLKRTGSTDFHFKRVLIRRIFDSIACGCVPFIPGLSLLPTCF